MLACSAGCAGSLMTAFYECPASFARLVEETASRPARLALFTLTQGWNAPATAARGACTETL